MNPSDAAWADHRSQIMLDPGVTQFNAGTCSPTPRAVFQRVTELRRMQASSPTGFQWRDAWTLLHKSREALGEYLNGEACNFALLENVTVALNIAAHSLDLPAGSEILISDHEYGSIASMWKRLAAARGWSVKTVELPRRIEDPAQIVEAFSQSISRQSKVLSFSHVSSPSGLIFPVRSLCDLARQKGLITVIDGAHAPGQVELDLQSLDADFYCANCHKWMMAPASVGFLCASQRGKAVTRSLVSSWGYGYESQRADEDVFPGTTRWQYDLEFHGTTDRTPQMVLPETIEFRRSIGGDGAVHARVRELSAYLRKCLAPAGFEAFLPYDERLVGSMTTFCLPQDLFKGGSFLAAPTDSPAQRFQKRLWDNHRIECPLTFIPDRIFLRVSTAWFNTTEEIDRLAEALKEELQVICA